jgi:hypothetical protein
MNYYKARELKTKGSNGETLWHYTCMNDGAVWPVGFCSPLETCPACGPHCGMGWVTVEHEGNPHDIRLEPCTKCAGKGSLFRENPCPGHANPEEACEHYRQYLLSQMQIRGPKTEEWPKDKCGVPDCNTEAKFSAIIAGHCQHFYALCDRHANKESVSPLVGPVGEVWSS